VSSHPVDADAQRWMMNDNDAGAALLRLLTGRGRLQGVY